MVKYAGEYLYENLNNHLPLSSLSAVVYNVKAYGAKGDGAKDDTIAVQAAVNAANGDGASLVFFPPGIYKVTALSNTSTINFVGDNASFIGYVGVINQFGDEFEVSYNAKDFGAKGDGVTDDTEIFQGIESLSGQLVSLPEGTYIVNGITLTKNYLGPGKIKLNGTFVGPHFANNTVLPEQGNYNLFFGGDQRKIDAEHFIIQNIPARNTDMNSQYFNWELIPHLMNFENFTGSSGYNTTVNGDSPAGQKVLKVRSTTPFAVGNQVLVAEFSALVEVCTIASIQAGVSLTMVSNLHFTHLAAAADSVALGGRTMQSAYHTNVNHQGSGDAYGHVYRVLVGKTPEATQYHFFQTSTGGMLGGDMYGMVDGVYLTGTEMQLLDTSSTGSRDIAAIGHVVTLNRTNNTGARGVVWFGTYFNSSGTQFADGGHVLNGKYKSGLDTVKMATDSDKSAIRMAVDQRIYFDCSGTPDVGGYSLYGNVIGDSWLGYESSLGAMRLSVDGLNALTITGLAMFTSGSVFPALDIAVQAGNKIGFEGNGGDTYFVFNGTNVQLFKNGAVVATW